MEQAQSSTAKIASSAPEDSILVRTLFSIKNFPPPEKKVVAFK